MTDQTFAVPGLTSGGAHYVRAVADAAFAVDGVAFDSRSPAVGAAGAVATSTTRSGPTRSDLTAAWSVERAAARAAHARGDDVAEWRHLERAHILSQPKALLHVRTHVAMLAAGIRRHDRREVAGQLLRLVVAGPGSLTGRYPVG